MDLENLFQEIKELKALVQQKTADKGSFSTQEKGGTKEMPKKLKYGQGCIILRKRKRKDGSFYEWYQVQWLDEYGKQLHATASTSKEAEKILSQKNPRSMKRTKKEFITFGQYFHEWYSAFGNRKCGPERNKSNLTQINRITKDIMDKPLSSLTALDLQGYLNSIKEPNPKVQTKQLMGGCLRHAFNNGHIKINLSESLYAKLPKVAEKQYLPKNLEDKFVSLFPEEYRNHIIGLIYTGTRISEFMDLNKNWKTDIDYVNKKVYIRETKSLYEEDRKGGLEYVIRELPLLDPIAAIKFPLKIVANQTINKNMNKVLAKMNAEDPTLNLKVTPHCMRHTFITRCGELKIDENSSMKWTGHKTNKMHQRYKHETPEMQSKARETLMKATAFE